MRRIRVRNQCEVIHRWPKAPEEVSYLKNPHRHIMHITTDIDVTHNDRELEFIMVKHYIDSVLREVTLPNTVSCESIAEYIVHRLQDKYGSNRYYRVLVEEDGENGAMIDSEEV